MVFNNLRWLCTESDSTIVFTPEHRKIFASFRAPKLLHLIADNTVDIHCKWFNNHIHIIKDCISSNDLLVTLDGVTQYPNTQSATRI